MQSKCNDPLHIQLLNYLKTPSLAHVECTTLNSMDPQKTGFQRDMFQDCPIVNCYDGIVSQHCQY